MFFCTSQFWIKHSFSSKVLMTFVIFMMIGSAHAEMSKAEKTADQLSKDMGRQTLLVFEEDCSVCMRLIDLMKESCDSTQAKSELGILAFTRGSGLQRRLRALKGFSIKSFHSASSKEVGIEATPAMWTPESKKWQYGFAVISNYLWDEKNELCKSKSI